MAATTRDGAANACDVPAPGHGGGSMSSKTVSAVADRHTYFKTRHRGLSYRNLARGGRRYYGYVPGKGRVPLEGTGEREALAAYGELRGKVGRGERVVVPSKLTVEVVAREWYEDA